MNSRLEDRPRFPSCGPTRTRTTRSCAVYSGKQWKTTEITDFEFIKKYKQHCRNHGTAGDKKNHQNGRSGSNNRPGIDNKRRDRAAARDELRGQNPLPRSRARDDDRSRRRSPRGLRGGRGDRNQRSGERGHA
ncbi:unnamed protein product, partial [Amoebophrya sp. A120]|eukprot:GSA120T00017824001.1